MPSVSELVKLLVEPNETLSTEYKSWLDLRQMPGRAKLAKAAIALCNHGGGVIVFGMREEDAGPFVSVSRPSEIARYTQDDVNQAVNRFAEPEFHCELSFATHPETSNEHAFVSVPGGITVPVMSRRDCEGAISARRCYIRKPGPRSEEPFTSEEWRALLDRCVRAGRDSMLEAIRVIVQGRAGSEPAPTAVVALDAFSAAGREQWDSLVQALAPTDPARFPNGGYELDFEILGAPPASSFAELRQRMDTANSIRHTGWGPFVQLSRADYRPGVVAGAIQAWLGRPEAPRLTGRDPAHSNFWRADLAGRLMLLRGYDEDGHLARVEPGKTFDITLPVWRVGEAVLYVQRLAETFGSDLSFLVRCRYWGLRGRKLVHLEGRRMLLHDYVSDDDTLVLEKQASTTEVRDNLAEVVRGLLTPLYERFSFFTLPDRLVSEELERMTAGRF